MGENIFSVTLITLLMFFWIDIFRNWYIKFLKKRGVPERALRLAIRALWIILTMLFWYTLLQRGLPEEFTFVHFAYPLFIFSLYGLLRSFIFPKKEFKRDN